MVKQQTRGKRIKDSLGTQLAALGLALVGLGLGGCFPDDRSSLPHPMTAPTVFPGQGGSGGTGGPTGGASTSLSQVNAQDWASLKGTYTGTLSKDGVNQSYTLILSEQVLQGYPYAYGTLQSAGPAAQLNLSFYMQLGYNNLYDYWTGTSFYSFTSTVLPVQMLGGWSDTDLAIEIFLALKQGYTGAKIFDPTQSAIHVKDCAFTNGFNSCYADPPGIGLFGLQKI